MPMYLGFTGMARGSSIFVLLGQVKILLPRVANRAPIMGAKSMMPLKELLTAVLRVRKPECDINSMIVNLVREST